MRYWSVTALLILWLVWCELALRSLVCLCVEWRYASWVEVSGVVMVWCIWGLFLYYMCRAFREV